MKKRSKAKNKLIGALYILLAAVLVIGFISFAVWFEIQRWHVYNITHHSNISYWTWQFFVNSSKN